MSVSPAADARLHAAALATLTDWAPPSEEQAALRDRFVAHLESRPGGVTRACYPDHLTASTLVLNEEGTHALLTLHRKAGEWFQLGGHCEPEDASLAEAAHREAVEESGLGALSLDPVPVQLSEHPVPFCDPRGGVHHLDVRFVAVAPADAEHAPSAESLDVRWWPVDDLPTDAPDIHELVALARQRVASA